MSTFASSVAPRTGVGASRFRPFCLLLAALAGVFPSLPASSAPKEKTERSKPIRFPAGIPNRPEKIQFPPLQYEPPDPKDYRLQLAAGPVTYIATDRELPLVNITVLVRTGDYVEPAGKEGVTDLAGYLLSRGGTKARTAEELEERLAFLAASLNSSVRDTQASVSLNLLSKDLDEGLAILREVLTEPRFQEDKFKLRVTQLMQTMKRRNDDSSEIESRERNYLVHGEQFFVNREVTASSLQSVGVEDVRAFHRAWFHPANFVVAASGDFDRTAMVQKLEKLFADWPFAGEKSPAIPTDSHFAEAGVYLVDKDVPQGRVSILLPGILRDNPDLPALRVMDDILGGGGFTSRIMNRVRSDEGLAYSAFSHVAPGTYYPGLLFAGFQSKSRTVAYATSIVIQEMKRIAAEAVSAEELNTSKRSFIDTFPRNFATKSQVVTTFAQDEFTGRHAREPDYYKTYRAKIEAVTPADVQRVARKYLDVSKVAILIVGKADEILRGHPDHAVDLPGLAGGRLTRVPLRDPLTMKPLASGGPEGK